MHSSSTETRADSTENLLQHEPTPESSRSQYLSQHEGPFARRYRPRTPLAQCAQQTTLCSTPAASLSVEDPPIMISTDEDGDVTPISHSQTMNPPNNAIVNSESTRSVPELELHSRIRGDSHPLNPANASSSAPSHDGLVCRHRYECVMRVVNWHTVLCFIYCLCSSFPPNGINEILQIGAA